MRLTSLVKHKSICCRLKGAIGVGQMAMLHGHGHINNGFSSFDIPFKKQGPQLLMSLLINTNFLQHPESSIVQIYAMCSKLVDDKPRSILGCDLLDYVFLANNSDELLFFFLFLLGQGIALVG
jgi:hypothetical protein